MIPHEYTDSVTRGLREAFGLTICEHVSRITLGQTSSLVFRIVVGGSPYSLKIITRAEDPTRHYTCMKAAAEAGLAPRVWYNNVEHKISITDFIEAEPLAHSEALVRLPAVLRTLHALPPFGRAPFNTTCTFLINKGPALDAYLEKFRAADVLPKAENDEFFARYAEMAAIYPYDDGEMVSSHNDLFKPDNILFDGQRVWLVDWEAAFLNDRYADLVAVANQVVTNDDDEISFLREYFGAAPDAYQLSRFHLMQQLSHLFYSMAFLFLGSSGKPIDWNRKVPDFSDYHRLRWAGAINMADGDAKLAYGRVHWERLRENVRKARYKQALRIVADGQARPTHARSARSVSR